MKRTAALWTVMLCTLGLAISGQAAEMEKKYFDDKVTVAGKELILNGLGLRTVNRYGLTIDVYVMGLYLPKKETDRKKIMESTEPKYIKMIFVRSVDAKTTRDGWRKGFLDNCEKDCESSREKINKFNDLMSNMKDNSAIAIEVTKDKVKVDVQAHYTKSGVIEGEDFARALPKIWLGDKPPTKELQDGILGLKNKGK